MGAIAGPCAGEGVRGGEGRAEPVVVFERIEAAIDLQRRVLKIVAEPCAIVAEVAERGVLGEAVHVEAHGAADAADEKAVREIVEAAATAVIRPKTREIAIAAGTLPGGQIAAKT